MKNIDIIMSTLEKTYQVKERTTLNRMRKEEGKDPFKILISCLISLRTKDENTEKVIAKLFPIASTPEQILALSTQELETLIFSSGHYHKKAMILKSVSKEILERFNGKVPDTEEELLSIKHIGRKTCNIVLNFAFDKIVIPVDVNVHRIANRLGWVKTKNADKTEEQLTKILDKKYWKEINALFILHGKSICVPISPFCTQCPISKYCPKVSVEKIR